MIHSTANYSFVYMGYTTDRFPERILDTSRTGEASTELRSIPVASKDRLTCSVVSPSTSMSCKENRPVEAIVVKMTINDPTAAVRTGKCRARAEFQITTKKLGVM